MIAAIAFNVLVRAEVDPVLGVSALVGIGCGLLVVVLGVRRRGRQTVRWVSVAGIAIGVIAVLAVAGAAVAVGAATSDLRAGNVSGRDAVSLLSDGDYQGATDSFAEAAAAVRVGELHVGRAVGPPRDADSRRRPEPRGGSRPLERSGRGIVGDRRRFRGHRRRSAHPAQRPLRHRRDHAARRPARRGRARRSIRCPTRSPTSIRRGSPGPLSERLDDLDDDLAEYRPQLANVVQAIERVPALLGADGPRRYFVAFTTPAETRGLGGFMGNWIELTADDGRIRVSDSGRTRDLNLGGDEPRVDHGPRRLVGDVGPVRVRQRPRRARPGAVPWSNITISPQFPSTGQVIAELYPQSGGRAIDGVFALDPYAVGGSARLHGADQRRRRRRRAERRTTSSTSCWSTSTRPRTTNASTSSRRCRRRRSGCCSPARCRGRSWSPTPSARSSTRAGSSGGRPHPDEQEYFADLGLTGSLPSIGEGTVGRRHRRRVQQRGRQQARRVPRT